MTGFSGGAGRGDRGRPARRQLALRVGMGMAVVAAMTLVARGIVLPVDSSSERRSEPTRFLDRSLTVPRGETRVICVRAATSLRLRRVAFGAMNGTLFKVIPPGQRATEPDRGGRFEVVPDPSAAARRRWCVGYTATRTFSDDVVTFEVDEWVVGELTVQIAGVAE